MKAEYPVLEKYAELRSEIFTVIKAGKLMHLQKIAALFSGEKTSKNKDESTCKYVTFIANNSNRHKAPVQEANNFTMLSVSQRVYVLKGDTLS